MTFNGSRLALVLGVFALGAMLPPQADAGKKVNVCHIPPGHPANFHTILISDNALAAHLAHGDLAGSCNDLCAVLCNDGDACTIDDTGDCGDRGCPAAGARELVDCDDGRECTVDSCDPIGGCRATPDVGATCDDGLVCTALDACTEAGDCQGQEVPGCCVSDADCDPSLCQGETCNLATNQCEANPVVCIPPDNCTASACDEVTGSCADVAVSCPVGEQCDLADGECKESGCSDGEREGFVNLTTHPAIAGCSGGWSLPGTLNPQSGAGCTAAGDDSANPSGVDCGAADLCAAGWRVCMTPADVGAHSRTGCGSVTQAGDPVLFFAQRQSGPGNGQCGSGANDIFGCGNVGATPAASCSPLTRFSHNLCTQIPSPPSGPWSCGSDGFQEANSVVKTDSSAGGVLCCRE